MYPEISEGLTGSATPESVFAWSLLLPLIGTGQSLMSFLEYTGELWCCFQEHTHYL